MSCFTEDSQSEPLMQPSRLPVIEAIVSVSEPMANAAFTTPLIGSTAWRDARYTEAIAATVPAPLILLLKHWSFFSTSSSRLKAFFESLKVALFAVSLGGVETLVTHPSTLTHTEFPEEEKVARGVTRTLIRVAVGIEDAEDLIEDFKQALEK